MGGNGTEKTGDGGAAADLVGTPVDQSRRMQGISQEEYLGKGAGDKTRLEMQLAGLERRRNRQTALIAFLLLGCGVVAFLLWLLA